MLKQEIEFSVTKLTRKLKICKLHKDRHCYFLSNWNSIQMPILFAMQINSETQREIL